MFQLASEQTGDNVQAQWHKENGADGWIWVGKEEGIEAQKSRIQQSR